MNEYVTTGNSESMATTVGAGINLSWNWEEYSKLCQGNKSSLHCPICCNHKSTEQIICSVCYTSILDSRNGAYPDRYSKVETAPTCSKG